MVESDSQPRIGALVDADELVLDEGGHLGLADVGLRRRRGDSRGVPVRSGVGGDDPHLVCRAIGQVVQHMLVAAAVLRRRRRRVRGRRSDLVGARVVPILGARAPLHRKARDRREVARRPAHLQLACAIVVNVHRRGRVRRHLRRARRSGRPCAVGRGAVDRGHGADLHVVADAVGETAHRVHQVTGTGPDVVEDGPVGIDRLVPGGLDVTQIVSSYPRHTPRSGPSHGQQTVSKGDRVDHRSRDRFLCQDLTGRRQKDQQAATCQQQGPLHGPLPQDFLRPQVRRRRRDGVRRTATLSATFFRGSKPIGGNSVWVGIPLPTPTFRDVS